ncbi:regucalcin-like [Contarinia nasturtii]|uniref:regucalcin-like n=1 Tax=Contarinia nasturtii TaxID=265458 RepID=UPI0012D46ED9|nr:regucalcin-like [Contarinia nasturtii]
MIPLKECKNQFAIGNKRTVTIIEWGGNNEDARPVRQSFGVEESMKYTNNDWNVAKASPKCQFYGGTFRSDFCAETASANGNVYRYTKCTGTKKLLRNIRASSGIEWNEDNNKFYHTDSCSGVIREYDWDPKTGDICNGRVVFKYKKRIGELLVVPIGLTIDVKGYLNATLYAGSCVLKINPRTSKVMKKITIPAEIVTSASFGGPNLDIHFVTTASKAFNLTDGGLSNKTFGPESGSVYMITGLKTKGYPGRQFCVRS